MYIPVTIIAVLAASSNEASARCNRDGIACVGVPTRAKDIDARQHRHRPVARFHLRTTDCSGFDHGPVYGPEPCNFPYNCEMFDGGCGHARALPHTIGR